MKKTVLAVLVGLFLILETTSAYCETPQFRKFRRGFCNLCTFYLEIGYRMEEEGKRGGLGQAATIGLAKGVGMAGVRALAGVYEVATFPVPFPARYEPVLNDPEFFWAEPFSEKGSAGS